MNVKEYIESGVLEAYVLDALPPEERAGVAADIARYPELAQEVRAIEEGLLRFAEAGSEAPAAFMKEQIWDTIAQQQENGPVPADSRSNVRPFTPQERHRQYTWQRAAVLAALVGSLLANFLLWNQRNRVQDENLAMNDRMDSLKQQQQTLALVVDNYRKEKDMMADTAMQPVLMKTMQPGHPMAATVYWSRTSGDAYLALQKLPMPPRGKQYQMWVIQDGKPVSMGVIPNEMVEKGMVSKLPMQVKNGQAFAISLEQEGGSPTPTMEMIQVLGKA